MKRTILCDCDGVLSDFVGGVNGYFTRNGVDPLDLDALHTHDMVNHMTEAQALAFADLECEPGFASTLEWYPGAKRLVEGLRTVGDVIIVTAPWGCPGWEKDRREWLMDCVHPKDVLFVPTKHKRLVHGDAFVEDNRETLRDWVRMAGYRFGCLWDRPWNRSRDKEFTLSDLKIQRHWTPETLVAHLESVL